MNEFVVTFNSNVIDDNEFIVRAKNRLDAVSKTYEIVGGLAIALGGDFTLLEVTEYTKDNKKALVN